MSYMLNVDLESANGTESLPCPSALHQSLGRHFDITIHAIDCFVRGGCAVQGRPRRFWDDHGGAGYNLREVVERIKTLRVQHPDAYPRRCSKCEVESNLPHWD